MQLFLMQGNFVIGVIVFAILVIVNFVVITKGSGRIAEVGARFSLDAMPGKQMAIDADLSAGLIDEQTARRRRKELEEESAFFGAMDGAAKFVRGDAVAGLLITGINLVGGLIIGVAQMDMSALDAAHTFTLLTIGDGLVSQVPALVVSVAAGLLVSKAGVEGRTDVALIRQLGAHPRALGMTAAISFILAALPGLPTVVFLLIGGASGFAAWATARRVRKAAEPEALAPQPASGDEPISAVLLMDPIRLELGYGLLGLIGETASPRLTDQIKALRRQLAIELGFVLPSVRIQDNIQLPANSYTLKIKEMEAGRGDIRASMLLVMDPQGRPITLPGEATTEPTFGLQATWISPALREEASFRGLTVVDPATVVTTHLTELVKDNLADLLTYAETQKLLGELPPEWQKLVQDLIPGRISMGGIHRVLQGLLAERISIRDLPTILEAVGEALIHTQNTVLIVEHVRGRLARQISTMFTGEGGYIPIVTLSPAWEQALGEALVGSGEERQLAIAPERLHQFIRGVRETFEALALRGELPVLVTTPALRPYVRSLIERFRASTGVLSQNEIHPKARIKTMGQV
ncbi:MAG TPA: flagellar biosynthesis protein FlhA [Geminicoccus sp.]|jgi:flagellar biosynthesis protein FlhA|uniref:flagellar biosynthesis protein FlhA n=1 Tax=Geminicoccus sp. TaxID=2024832 RepID=UPI002E34FF50|nr:flagellar biosynthesis protein FlhA [Geminicoccus sp.]HEX2526930.1 flagellar biosynthesis protein FlhA [Geminicoccus sp.]